MSEIEWKKLHPWMEAAYQHGIKHDSWHDIAAGSKEADAWAKYFARLGWTPIAFRALGRSAKWWTAPCQWPEWMEPVACESRANAPRQRFA